MLGYTYAKSEIESMHIEVAKFENMGPRQKRAFRKFVKGHCEVMEENITLFPMSLRMEAKRATSRANKALNG